MPSLSLSMIVRDEAKSLPRLFKGLHGIFDQIVIVDTGSIDNTREIARHLGAEVYEFQWLDDFSAARNFSLSKCRSDYCMWLDADDTLSSGSIEALKKLKDSLTLSEIYLAPYDYCQDEFGNSIVSIFNFRVFKNDQRVTWKWPIHECLVFPDGWASANVPELVVKHNRTSEDATKDIGRNIRLLKKAVEQNPREPRVLFYYAKELFNENQFGEAIEAFKRYFDNGGGWHEDNVNGRFLTAASHHCLGDADKTVETAFLAIREDARWAEPFNLIGQVYYNKEDWGRAIPWFEAASKMPVPQTWGTILSDNYTWVPWDRLCFCYSKVGRIRDAYEANEKALGYRPGDPRFLFNREFLSNLLFPGRVVDRPLRLSLGSGGKPTNSYRLTDAYQCPGVEEVFPQGKIPYPNSSFHAIQSEHALEHAGGHIDAEATIQEWGRVARHGGHLSLKVPDLTECCRGLAGSEDRGSCGGERWSPRDWFRYTLYGIQTSLNGEPQEGQYHRTGFTPGILHDLLEKNGFEINKIYSYDGYGTPSLGVEAVQTRNPIRVAWALSGGVDDTHGSIRIRRTNVCRWLSQHGVDSQFVDINVKENLERLRWFDVVVWISFGETERNIIEELTRRGVKCVYDHCEDLDGLQWQNECFQNMDTVVCCSSLLTEKSSEIYGRAVFIPDAFEV